MLVKVVKVGNLYSVEVIDPGGHVRWQSAQPMPTNELWIALRSAGCSPEEIVHAFEGVPRPSAYYHLADDMRPQIKDALGGQREVAAQRPFAEAWISYALLCEHASGHPASPLEDILEQADSVNVLVPTADEVSWAFLQLRKRGWLATDGATFGLTSAGRQAMDDIVGRTLGFEAVKRLEAWILEHPG